MPMWVSRWSSRMGRVSAESRDRSTAGDEPSARDEGQVERADDARRRGAHRRDRVHDAADGSRVAALGGILTLAAELDRDLEAGIALDDDCVAAPLAAGRPRPVG